LPTFRYTMTAGTTFTNIQQPIFQLAIFFTPTDDVISGIPSDDTYVIKVDTRFTTTTVTGVGSRTITAGTGGYKINAGTVRSTAPANFTFNTTDATVTALAVTKSGDANKTVLSPYYLKANYINLVYTSIFTSTAAQDEPLAFAGGFTHYDITFTFTTAPTAYSTLSFRLSSSLGATTTTGYLGRISQLGSSYVSTVWPTSSATICFLNGETNTVVKFSVTNPNNARRTLITGTNNGSTSAGVGTADIPIVCSGQHSTATAYNSFDWFLSAGLETGTIQVVGRNT